MGPRRATTCTWPTSWKQPSAQDKDWRGSSRTWDGDTRSRTWICVAKSRPRRDTPRNRSTRRTGRATSAHEPRRRRGAADVGLEANCGAARWRATGGRVEHPDLLNDVVARFAIGSDVVAVESFRGPAGQINASYVVTARRGDRSVRFFLQRLNKHVFPDLDALMDNVARVTRHVGGPLRLVPTREGQACARDDHGDVWRLYDYIERASTRETPSVADAERAAGAFGAFQRALADLPGPRLHETIPYFHDTPRRLESFECAVECDTAHRASEARGEIARIHAHQDLAAVLIQSAAGGSLPERIVHNDAKLANVLFDAASGDALCVVDLDTVMPGLALYDFGDLVR